MVDRVGFRANGLAVLAALMGLALVPLAAQERNPSETPPGGRRSFEVEPASLVLSVGEKAALTATVRDADGARIDAPVVFTSRSRRSVGVTRDGEVEAYRPGEYILVATVPAGDRGQDRLRVEIPVTIPQPPLERIVLKGVAERLYAGTLVETEVEVYDATGAHRSEVGVDFETSDPAVLTMDGFGRIMTLAPGAAVIRVEAGTVSAETAVHVVENPAVELELNPGAVRVRTGDVVRFESVARDRAGNAVGGLPVLYSVRARPNLADPASGASGQIAQDGRFVAELPGRYTVAANVGPLAATAIVEVRPRGVAGRLELVGRAPVRDRHSSDLWVWEGVDGRDYAITGTWGSEGHAYIWDVTEPSRIRMIDSVQVDARTVNDVKVSEDGRIAVISREGASNRRNGLVILDVSNPRQVRKLAEYDDELTGGVHNIFIYKDHVYAVNNGRRYDIINIAEPAQPFRVSRFELDTPGHALHDVWVEDGVAYSSNWADGVVLVDVGNGIAGGSPGNPVRFASYADPKGYTHAAFPFRSQSTGRFYVVTGDEIFPSGLDPEGPTATAGYMHVVDFTDPAAPVEVARFEVPEKGSHNLWIENDILYAAFYNGGLRIVDLSGELMGDLYRQGREIASFHPNDSEGYVKNEPMVWGAQPYEGLIYFSDWNSGLWAVRLVRD